MRAYKVLRARSVESRFEAMHGGALTPLVGRDEEIEILCVGGLRAKAGKGQVVLLSGEAGIGKSRPRRLDRAVRCRTAYAVALFRFPAAHRQRSLSNHMSVRASGAVLARHGTIRRPNSTSSTRCWRKATHRARTWGCWPSWSASLMMDAIPTLT